MIQKSKNALLGYHACGKETDQTANSTSGDLRPVNSFIPTPASPVNKEIRISQIDSLDRCHRSVADSVQKRIPQRKLVQIEPIMQSIPMHFQT
mmetsp:Transcript_15894/g.36651  ORF Transcript_15894/g.36651 Transcript_15894/m.36651 type:complete len:93 (-) Transcript_15894:461-739(-)